MIEYAIFDGISILFFIYILYGISISLFIYILCRYLYRLHRYNRYKACTREVVSSISKVSKRLCLEADIPIIECILAPFSEYNPSTIAFFRREREARIWLMPQKWTNPDWIHIKPVLHVNILYTAAHEVCHYIQYLEHSTLTKKEREREAQEVGLS